MSDWYSKNLGEVNWADAALQQVQDAFAEQYPDVNDAAVFVRHETVAHLHCNVIIYFSPAASTLAKACGAEICAAPEKTGLALHAGDETVWSRLFTI